MSLVWKDPPAETWRGKGRWLPILDELKRNPGKWALVAENINPGTGYSLKMVHGVEVRLVRSDTCDDKKRDLYARWPEAKS